MRGLTLLLHGRDVGSIPTLPTKRKIKEMKEINYPITITINYPISNSDTISRTIKMSKGRYKEFLGMLYDVDPARYYKADYDFILDNFKIKDLMVD